ncbi:hypothetical protein HYFRA_00009400 [Hymenoscyphus fraxineus]|uniref:Uncharacterized protein n=1 Tax=Hymenoscyphus fraxineus TaxID=746836 RepID=A0A9N9PKJ7_9HELO|nr:hypothetical protein HYFRA_00009400 [Hymenoscyphus fraxineus]
MLDENLPTFYIKAATSDNPLSSVIYLTQNASELMPQYSLRRPDPALPATKNCYAVALYDSYSPEVLYAEVLVQPEWSQPTLSAAEVRAANGVPAPPVPIVPTSFVIQLYNPDQQVKVRQIPGTWNRSEYWEFEMPQSSFRLPSASALDRIQDDPAASDITPKVSFKWKKDGKLTRDISCYLSGKTTDGKKSKEPDIIVAMYKAGKDQNSLTLYQPNMYRVDVEDVKGLEVVFLLGAAVIKDIFFNASREMFNIGSPPTAHKRKNSGPVIGGRKNSGNNTAMMSGGVSTSPPRTSNIPSSQIPPQKPNQRPQQAQPTSRPPPADPRTQWEIDAETARLKAIVAEEERKEKLREKEVLREQRRIKKMLEEEDRERLRKEAEVARETERLRKQYGVPAAPPPQKQPQRVQFQQHPPLPVRPHSNSLGNRPGLSQQQSAPHTQPQPYQRPMSTSSVSQNSPYLAPTSQGLGASASGFFSSLAHGGKKVQKKRSVFF